jgi:hypothetical protein
MLECGTVFPRIHDDVRERSLECDNHFTAAVLSFFKFFSLQLYNRMGEREKIDSSIHFHVSEPATWDL